MKKQRSKRKPSFPKKRNFEVLKAIRRCNRVAYLSGNIYTIIEDSDTLIRKYPTGYLLCLVRTGTGWSGNYAEKAALGWPFAYHELDVLVGDGILKEIDLTKNPEH